MPKYMLRPRPEGTVLHYNEIKKGDFLFLVHGSYNSDVKLVEIASDLKGNDKGKMYFEAYSIDEKTGNRETFSWSRKTKPLIEEHFVYDRNLDPEMERPRYNDNYFFRTLGFAEAARDFFRSNYVYDDHNW